MKIAIPKGGGEFHLLTNEGLSVGDQVFPMTFGYTQGGEYYVLSLDRSNECSGWPDKPHTILDLHYSESKSCEIRTDHGYGPVESYFKITQ